MIVKDLTARVDIANQKYLDSLEIIEGLKDCQLDPMKLPVRLREDSHRFGELLAEEGDDGKKWISISQLIQNVEKVLVYRKQMINEIIDDFVKADFWNHWLGIVKISSAYKVFPNLHSLSMS